MPNPVYAYNIHGKANPIEFATGGGNLYLFPKSYSNVDSAEIKLSTGQSPGDPGYTEYSTSQAVREARQNAMSLWLWKDASRREFAEGLRPWCTLTDEGLKITLKQGEVEFAPNNGPKIKKKTGILEEATATCNVFDITLSPEHYIDIAGNSNIVNTGDNVKFVSIAPSKPRDYFAAYVMEHPAHEGRYTVVWFYGELSVDYESEFSISNPLKAAVTFALKTFPHITLPNNTNGVYQILEVPIEEEPLP